MRFRVFDADDFEQGGLHDFDADIVPAVGDLLSSEYGNGTIQAYEVTSRVMRLRGNDVIGEIFFVGLAARRVSSDTGLLSYCK